MPQTIRKTATAVAALGALALGGSALADAATSSNSNSSSSSANGTAAAYGQDSRGDRDGRDPTKPGGHVGANGKTEQALSAADAAKVKAAALKKVPGGTVERVETDVDHGSPFEAHVRKSDGTELEVLVNSQFQVTAVNSMQHP
jgi:uncharacterized membrane protein YkoI